MIGIKNGGRYADLAHEQPHRIKKGDTFNVYCFESAKFGATWTGSLEQSLSEFATTHPGFLAGLADAQAAAPSMNLPAVGQRVRLTEEVAIENWVLPCEGLEGTVITSSMDEIAVKFDESCPDLAAWDNCILWNPSNEPAENGYEGALARFWRQVELLEPSLAP